MVSSASQSPVSTSMGPPSTISRAAESRSPKKPEQLAMRSGSVTAGTYRAHRRRQRLSFARPARLLVRLHQGQQATRLHLVTDLHVDLGHRARNSRVHRVLHLHGFEHHQDRSGLHPVPGGHRHPDDAAGHGGECRALAAGWSASGKRGRTRRLVLPSGPSTKTMSPAWSTR